MSTKAHGTALALGAGVAVPLLYFGAQIVAAPFYPGYSFLAQAASELGSPGSRLPAVFNSGAVLTGLATLAAAYGFLRALRRLGSHPMLAWLAALATALKGLGSIWAGVYPLPDPRHGANPSTPAIFLLPALLLAALWTRPWLSFPRLAW